MNKANKHIKNRAYTVYAGVFLVCALVLVRVFTIQHFEPKWKEMSKSIVNNEKIVPAIRGNIFGNNGESMLSTSVHVYTISMDPTVIKQKIIDDKLDSLVKVLTVVFPRKTAQQYKDAILDARKLHDRYFTFSRKASYLQLKELKKAPIFRRGRIKGGLIVEGPYDKRERLFGQLGRRTIGYTKNGKDTTLVGLEGFFNNDLKGIPGRLKGRQIVSHPKDGRDLFTSIDINVQDAAESALKDMLEYQDAQYGCAVVMEVKTGYIKAIANLSRIGKSKNYGEIYNYAVGRSLEPGSTFKLASLMVALEDGCININDNIDTKNGLHKFYDRWMRDSHVGGYGKISIKDAFAYSSNVGVSKTVYNYYSKKPQKFIAGLKRMGIGQKTGIQIHGEADPYIKDSRDPSWSGITLPWMSIGYEVSLSPLQMLSFYNAVANDGKWMKPQLVQQIKEGEKIIKQFDPVVLKKQICSPSTIKAAKEMLQAVAEYGTAKNVNSKFYSIAGKTGTNRLLKNGKYIQKYQASFAGYFPAENPRYSCIVIINNPKRSYYGASVAGPVFKTIADQLYATDLDFHPYSESIQHLTGKMPASKNGFKEDIQLLFKKLNIKVNDQSQKGNWVKTQANDNDVNIKERKFIPHIVPNVLGMGLKDALFVLENKGLQVEVRGAGAVKRQSLRYGTRFEKGQMIIIELT